MKILRNTIVIWLIIIFLVTFFSLLTYIVAQQVVRLGADNLPVTFATEASIKLAEGSSPAESVPTGTIDISKSLETFVMVFDSEKELVATSALLGNEKPVYPKGILDYVEKYGEDRVTWQPVTGPPRQSEFRFATVTIKSGDYYVVAGHSLRETERLIDKIGNLILFAWIACVVFSTIAMVIIYFFIKKVLKTD